MQFVASGARLPPAPTSDAFANRKLHSTMPMGVCPKLSRRCPTPVPRGRGTGKPLGTLRLTPSALPARRKIFRFVSQCDTPAWKTAPLREKCVKLRKPNSQAARAWWIIFKDQLRASVQRAGHCSGDGTCRSIVFSSLFIFSSFVVEKTAAARRGGGRGR